MILVVFMLLCAACLFALATVLHAISLLYKLLSTSQERRIALEFEQRNLPKASVVRATIEQRHQAMEEKGWN